MSTFISAASVPSRIRRWTLLLLMGLFGALAPAFAQADFTLTASPPSPFALEPGGTSSSVLTINTLNSSSGIVVNLSCAVTPVLTTGTPTCSVSPASITTPATPSLTITTTGTTPAGLYTITVTGDAPSITMTHTVTVNLSVLAVTADYTLAVTTPITPSTVHAGSGATGVITVTSLNGYSGAVTLSCSAVSPAVEFGPTCSFAGAVTVSAHGTQTGTLTINTIGTSTTAATTTIPRSRVFYALLVALPGLVISAAGFRRRKFVLLFAVVGIALVLFLPACGSSYNKNSNTNNTTTSPGTTPKNSYTFTITGTDTNALAPSNGTQSVSLTVN